MKEYHVSINGNDGNVGSAEKPFRSISRAAQLAKAGDTVTVHGGVYREWVKPRQGGKSDEERIVYRAAKGERAVIKGSEIISDWRRSDGIWTASVSNEIFGDYNPYVQVIDGDWLLEPRNPFRHTGEVYLNGKALHEVFGTDEVRQNPGTWYAEPTDGSTEFFVNFGSEDPNGELVEINVRKCCFYPDKTGLNYITVQGFEMAQAACPWAPPTAEQFGMLGVHWSRGWIIEDNILHDAKCSAVSLGKNATIADNAASVGGRKSGYQYQIENIFRAEKFGWTKDKVGSHTVRNNLIFDCGQNGIVGQMGCAFSEIYGNHIYNIGNKNEFRGWEIAGIKFHAAIDVQIHDNCIHDCGWVSGIWLDWQAQGTRVSRNLMWGNDGQCGDLFIEVSHGPYTVDNNIFASKKNIHSVSQGGAFIHNVFFGINEIKPCLERSTPYHGNHTTDVAGFCCIYGNDDRWYQNIFLGEYKGADGAQPGTNIYNGCPDSIEQCIRERGDGEGSGEKVKQPAYIDGNCYFNGACAYDGEKHNLIFRGSANPKIVNENGNVYLEIDIPEEIRSVRTKVIGTADLEPPRICDLPYENPDGTPMVIDRDYFGKERSDTPTPGPFENLKAGHNRIAVRQEKNLG